MSETVAEFKKGDRVRFIRPPKAPQFRQHYDHAQTYIDRGKIYVVEHYFYGEPGQVELVGIDSTLFVSEMFVLVD